MITSVLLLLAGVILAWFGGSLFVDGAVGVDPILNVRQQSQDSLPVRQHLEFCRSVDVLRSYAASVAHQLKANAIELDPRAQLPAAPKITRLTPLIRLLSLE